MASQFNCNYDQTVIPILEFPTQDDYLEDTQHPSGSKSNWKTVVAANKKKSKVQTVSGEKRKICDESLRPVISDQKLLRKMNPL